MSDKKQLIKSVFVGVLTSALTEIILMSLFSVLIITSGLLPADITDYIMVAVTAMSVFCGGFICAKVNKSSGLICGLLSGGICNYYRNRAFAKRSRTYPSFSD